MRRLPVYLVLDNSGSMHGEAIEAVKNGVQVLASTLRQDPYALETAFISVITFNTDAKQLVPLTDLVSFQPPDIRAQGITSLGRALTLTAEKINDEVVKTTPDRRGDWKPLIFLMTDGGPTDEWRLGLEKLRKAKPGMIIACAAGMDADVSVLKEISEVVVQLDTADSGTIKKFFQWISASVSSGSQKIDLSKKDVSSLDELPPPPPEINIVT
ncbi:MAG: VWA domain-containing protein [Candidatus Electrothrix sp. Rat3]|nr:VWA domain-containing protein [Candidatus Electrothrix rattekaaiensis]